MRTALRIHSATALLDCADPRRVAAGEVHVWAFELAAPEKALAACAALISAEERAKAGRFVFERDRTHYLLAHAVMRSLLGSYLGSPAATLEMNTGARGKPALAGSQVDRVSFNLTHSGGRALLAISDGREVGIDLEQHRQIEAASIAGNYFFGSERDAILRGPDIDTVFFQYWTAKEAVMKGCGEGLSLPLDDFAIQFSETQTDAGVYSRDVQKLEPDWRVQTLSAGLGWSAAVAARGTEWQVLLPEA